MSSTEDFEDYVLDQIPYLGKLSYRKMSGEYCIYANEKVLEFITNDRLFIKSMDDGLKFHNRTLGESFPSGNEYILIEDELENPDLLKELIEV